MNNQEHNNDHDHNHENSHNVESDRDKVCEMCEHKHKEDGTCDCGCK